jgi:hypothetical protein
MLSVIKLSESDDIQYNDTQQSDIQQMTLSMMALSIGYSYAECLLHRVSLLLC